ncbi:mycofactocin-coupled SDR family oxidoreductase [Nocardioides sp. WS12]|uniref:mycofactocin-coupled SDR family oxidoreductase n=1 Tax=Nocardioides sp. WS12 TaxID=2486272 RepID=UPI0015F8F7BD|nr:mycofactocin-coupled SDR family oxidoreductase [Nocardioides sp. WS12]
MSRPRVEGKVALVTGAGRGQGRSHAVRLAEEGADIIAIDICRQIDSSPIALSTAEDLASTAQMVEALGRRAHAAQTDVRDLDALTDVINQGVAKLGRLDIVVANAGIFSVGRLEDLDETAWRDMLDVNLTGVWQSVRAAVPHLRREGGGSIVLISSTAGIRGSRNIGHYSAAKHGVIGQMKTWALELASDSIRVNAVVPTTVDTPMVQNPYVYGLFAPDLDEADRTREIIGERFQRTSALPVPWVEPLDISNAVLWLASEESRFVSGTVLPVDLGNLLLPST